MQIWMGGKSARVASQFAVCRAMSNPFATKADYGYKQAIGMYTFDWG
eukprot:COSAG01_NODE_401_length_17529_cov_47.865806_9_plen_47_part_00